jgi:hypothetical protein
LLERPDWCRGAGRFPITAYSEFLPPPWLGVKPSGEVGALPGPRADDWGWGVTEYEQQQELLPGLELIARGALQEIVLLGEGKPTPHIARSKLDGNPYWPSALAQRAGQLAHERYVLLLPVALSRTQDDKGRVRWALFGSSEQGPARPFWRSFFTAPGEEAPAESALAFFVELLSRAYGVSERTARQPARAGLRILPTGPDPLFPYWDEGPLPSWAEPLLWREDTSLKGARFLLTFRPFERLPTAVQEAYVKGDLHLLPFPGSLAFWGAPPTRRLSRELPFAMQLPLLQVFPRRNAPEGLRVPQSGWLHEKVEPPAGSGTDRPLFVRTHRWQKTLRHQDEVAVLAHADRVTRVLFSTEPDDIALYNKPMARNVQLWTHDYRLLLDGPRQRHREIEAAELALARGGRFGYRFLYPAMRVGRREVYWQRPVCAFRDEQTSPRAAVAPLLLLHAPRGYLTAYDADKPDLARPIELWPRLLDRAPHQAAVELFRHEDRPRRWATTDNIRALLEWHDLLEGVPLPPSLARALLVLPRKQTLDGWLAGLAGRAIDRVPGRGLVEELYELLAPEDEEAPPGEGLTFAWTCTREFEVAYWKTIAELAHGQYQNKSNADCVRDDPTRAALEVYRRQLIELARHLIGRHTRTIEEAGLAGQAWVAEHNFAWRTDFNFSWMGGWLSNRKGPRERNIVVRIPGRDSTQAVIMADHYDTAYMHDHYYHEEGGTGARVAAAGADDNHSATAALLLAAPIFLELSKAGKLARDIYLVHLTGEEFPSDCLGARHLCQAIVEGTLKVQPANGDPIDLSHVKVRGVYVSDMIAHNNDHNRYVFQIAPGAGPASARLAVEAHRANLAWNALARARNRVAPRKGLKEGKRVGEPEVPPATAKHAILRGEVRPDWEPRSTLYNTDGQIFSDAGVPVVLFMEDYDINRRGYHDSYDTMANIDLDYGSALAAIVIETVARAASL